MSISYACLLMLSISTFVHRTLFLGLWEVVLVLVAVSCFLLLANGLAKGYVMHCGDVITISIEIFLIITALAHQKL